jgi:hypothetical protein
MNSAADLSSTGINRFFSSFQFNVDSQITADSIIKLNDSITISNIVSFLNDSLIKAGIEGSCNVIASVDSSSKIVIHGDAIFNAMAGLVGIPKAAVFFLESLLSANIDLQSIPKLIIHESSLFQNLTNFQADSKIKIFSISELNNIASLSADSKVKVQLNVSLDSLVNLISVSSNRISASSLLGIESLLLAGVLTKISSGSQLNSDSSFYSDSLLRYFPKQTFDVKTNLSDNSNIRFFNGSILNTNSSLLLNENLRVTGSAILGEQTNFILNYLNKIHSDQSLDASVTTVFSSFLKSKISATLPANAVIESFATIRLYPTVNVFKSEQSLILNPSLHVTGSSNLNVESLLASQYFTKVIGLTELNINSKFDSDSLIKMIGATQFDVSTSLQSSLGIRYFNNIEFEIVGVLSANLSQRNRDIVYYVMYTQKSQPFNLYIARVQ